MGVSTEPVRFGRDEDELYRELYAGLPVLMPELEHRDWPQPSGIVAGRRDGLALGWAYFFQHPSEPDVAYIQWLLLSRERERIMTGHTVQRGGTADEIDALAGIFGGVAEQARKAGYASVQWNDTEADLDQKVAARLGAPVHEQLNAQMSVYRLAL